ncbi:MAG: peroxiredoxin [Ignavibacteriales bacterium]|nr:MAG: peroxiredoxin [Ignavibacteriales bacterium]
MKTSFIILIFVIISSVLFSQDKIEVGNKAPDFSLEDAYGKEYTLSSYFGKSPVVIYFYPQAGTSGCTKQACAIRDDWNKFEDNNITVLGISTDSKDEIKTFVDVYSLNFPLLSDNDKNVSRDYGALKENGNAKRVTFIVDMDGNIADILEVNDIDSHSDYVFNAASKLIKSN